MASFHDGAHGHAKRLAAGIALEQTWAVALAFHQGGIIDGAAMRANRTHRPMQRFHVGASGVFVIKDRIC